MCLVQMAWKIMGEAQPPNWNINSAKTGQTDVAVQVQICRMSDHFVPNMMTRIVLNRRPPHHSMSRASTVVIFSHDSFSIQLKAATAQWVSTNN